MGKFIDIIESRLRDYRDRGDSEDDDTSYDFMNPLANDQSQSDTTYPDPLGNHNNSQQEPSASEDPVEVEPEKPAADVTPTTEPDVDPAPEVETEPEEQSVEQLLAAIGGERGESITRINDYFNKL